MSVPRLAVFFLLGTVVLTTGLVGCSGTNEVTGGSSQVRVLLTDAPSDSIESANVTISRVYLTSDAGPHVDVMPAGDPSVTYDLLDLRNGVEALLADRVVPAGTYGQLRLVVESADVTLVPGLTFEDGTNFRSLKVPSGMQSGIKVQLATPIDADPGEITIVVVDFDVNQNFVLQGATGTTVNDVLFTPLLQEKRRDGLAMP
ncbi:MAG TPA: DUF4382 domain-containing protein [Candidatus Polarisedimenticolaceae bacterium]